MKYVLGLLLVVLAPCATFGQVLTGAPLVRFNGGIGVIPGTTNTVRGVAPAGQIWVISSLRAAVNTAGQISVQGTGLLLGGGNGIGTSAGLRIFATLFCGPAGSATASSTTISTSGSLGVQLTGDGAFAINADTLSPPPPDPCTTPVLLIRSTGGSQPWFAAGIPVPATP
jgi:hypothetical protein